MTSVAFLQNHIVEHILAHQGPVVQSVVSLISSLVVKMLTVLVCIISNSQVFLPKNVSSIFTHFFFSKNISVYMYAIFNDQSFNDTLTNDIASFEQLGPDKEILDFTLG